MIIFWIKKRRQNRIIYYSESLILGSLYTLCPGGFSNAKLYKIDSLILLRKKPLIQSHFNGSLSIPVMLISLSLLNDPGINWVILPISPRILECDWVKPNIVKKKKTFKWTLLF